MKVPYDLKAKPAAASDLRCPSCQATESLWAKPLLSWWSDGKRVYAHVVGQLVVCLRCDQAYAVTPAGSFVKRLPQRELPMRAPTHRLHPDGDAARELAAAVAQLPPEP